MINKMKKFLNGLIVTTMVLTFTPAQVAVIEGKKVVAIVKNAEDKVEQTFIEKAENRWTNRAKCACAAKKMEQDAIAAEADMNIIKLDEDNISSQQVIAHLESNSEYVCIEGPNADTTHPIKPCGIQHKW